MLNFRLARPSSLVDLGAIDELVGVRLENDALIVGAMTRQWDLERSDDASRSCGTRSVSSVTRQRAAGGRWRFARPRRPDRRAAGLCGCARGGAGDNRRTIPAEEFFVSVFTTALEPGELLVEVRFPAPSGRSAFEEHTHRHGDFAVVCVAVAGDRVALGGVAPTPVLWDGGELEPVGDLFAPAGYKREVAAALIEKARG